MTIDIISHLTELGFGEYEARAYTALVRRNPLTGYELAKVSGVPRPNIYAVIERLQHKGAVGPEKTKRLGGFVICGNPFFWVEKRVGRKH